MPKGGVNELLKSPSGRAHLAELQKRHWKDILQPGDKFFDKVYGDKLRREERLREKNERIARDMRLELEEKKKWKKNQKR